MKYYTYMQGVLYDICKKTNGTPIIKPLAFYSEVSGTREQKHSFYVYAGNKSIRIGSNVPHGQFAVGLLTKSGIKYYLTKNVPSRTTAVKMVIEAILRKKTAKMA